jgi:hypothetical protein
MNVVTRVSVASPGTPEEVFDAATQIDKLGTYFRGKGPVPGIERAEVVGGGPLVAGCKRRIHNSDGSVIDEDMEILDRGAVQQYRIRSGIKWPLSWLARGILSRWEFAPDSGGTRIDWRFDVELTTPLAYPTVRIVVQPFLRAAMRECLERIAADMRDR